MKTITQRTVSLHRFIKANPGSTIKEYMIEGIYSRDAIGEALRLLVKLGLIKTTGKRVFNGSWTYEYSVTSKDISIGQSLVAERSRSMNSSGGFVTHSSADKTNIKTVSDSFALPSSFFRAG